MKIIATILILAIIAPAAPLPDTPSHTHSQPPKPSNVWLEPFRDPFFYAGTLAATSGVLADVHFVQGCERDKTCVEQNPPSDQYKFRIPEIALVATASYGCSLMLHGHRWYRAFCMVGPVAIGLYHWHDTHIQTR